MVQPQKKTLQEQAQLLPTKDTLTALKSDVTLESAVLELCDNALDAWKRTQNREGSMTIDISVDVEDETTTLVIQDNAGGVPREDAAMLFGLGQTAKEHIIGSIGTYGVGAKKSLVNLGVPFQIFSRANNEATGWTFRITEDWFEDDQDWTVSVQGDSNIEPGKTVIQIENLNYAWDGGTETRLRERLGEAYNIFLSEKLQALHGTSYDLTIRVNGTAVEPEGMPEWSFSPFDGIHPRRFENIQIKPPGLSQPVSVDITVGLLVKKDSKNAGTDIYCQKRKIGSNLRNEEGGFGTGRNQLGAFSSRHERLKVIIEMETEGDGQQLPWDTQKSSIDTHNPIMRGTSDSRGVYNWLRRVVQGYYDLDADKIPTAFVAPYDASSEYAVNGGCPVQLDYTERERVVGDHSPDTNLPEVSELNSRAAAHAKLWISGENSIEDWKLPAYQSQLNQESDRNLENLTRINDLPSKYDIEEMHEIIGRVNELGRIHLEKGIYYPDDLAPWQLPRYQGYMDRYEGGIPAQADSVPNDLPKTPADIGNQDLTKYSSDNETPTVQTGQSLDEESVQKELAEVFLVLGGDSEDERGAKVFELSRRELCYHLGLEVDAVDELLWEQLEMKFQDLIDGSQ